MPVRGDRERGRSTVSVIVVAPRLRHPDHRAAYTPRRLMLALLLVAALLGASNFAAAIGIGLVGIDARLRIRVALAFGLFEGGMPIVGLAVGRQIASTVGSHANLLAGGLLIATGAFTAIAAWRDQGADDKGADLRQASMGRLFISGAALSVDNLIVGFALGTYKTSIITAAAVITIVSVAVSMIGLEVGARIARKITFDADVLSGAVLMFVGAPNATRIL